jgi:hypothetical protein
LYGIRLLIPYNNLLLREEYALPDETQVSKSAIALSTVAFALNGAWVNLVGYGPAQIVEVNLFAPVTINRLAFLIACMATGIIFVFVPRLLNKRSSSLIGISGLLCVTGTILHFLPLAFSFESIVFFIIMSNCCVAVGSVCNQLIIFTIILKRSPLHTIAWFALTATAISNLLFMIIQSFVTLPTQAGFILLFSISIPPMFLWLTEKTRDADHNKQPYSTVKHSLDSSPKKQVVSLTKILENRAYLMLLVGAAVIVVVAYGSSEGGIWGGQRALLIPDLQALLYLLLATAVFLVVGIFSMVLFIQKRSLQRFQLPIVVLITGFIILAASEITPPPPPCGNKRCQYVGWAL